MSFNNSDNYSDQPEFHDLDKRPDDLASVSSFSSQFSSSGIPGSPAVPAETKAQAPAEAKAVIPRMTFEDAIPKIEENLDALKKVNHIALGKYLKITDTIGSLMTFLNNKSVELRDLKAQDFLRFEKLKNNVSDFLIAITPIKEKIPTLAQIDTVARNFMVSLGKTHTKRTTTQKRADAADEINSQVKKEAKIIDLKVLLNRIAAKYTAQNFQDLNGQVQKLSDDEITALFSDKIPRNVNHEPDGNGGHTEVLVAEEIPAGELNQFLFDNQLPPDPEAFRVALIEKVTSSQFQDKVTRANEEVKRTNEKARRNNETQPIIKEIESHIKNLSKRVKAVIKKYEPQDNTPLKHHADGTLNTDDIQPTTGPAAIVSDKLGYLKDKALAGKTLLPTDFQNPEIFEKDKENLIILSAKIDYLNQCKNAIETYRNSGEISKLPAPAQNVKDNIISGIFSWIRSLFTKVSSTGKLASKVADFAKDKPEAEVKPVAEVKGVAEQSAASSPVSRQPAMGVVPPRAPDTGAGVGFEFSDSRGAPDLASGRSRSNSAPAASSRESSAGSTEREATESSQPTHRVSFNSTESGNPISAPGFSTPLLGSVHVRSLSSTFDLNDAQSEGSDHPRNFDDSSSSIPR